MNKNLKLIVFSGLPGAGKSTFAYKTSCKLKLPIFSVDPIESAIIKSGITKSFETGLAAYLIAQRLADEQLGNGISAIIDAVSSVREAKDMWINLAAKYSAQLVIIECILNEDLHKQRLQKRVRNLFGFSEVKWEQVLKIKIEYTKWNKPKLQIDTGKPVSANFMKIIKYIKDFGVS